MRTNCPLQKHFGCTALAKNIADDHIFLYYYYCYATLQHASVFHFSFLHTSHHIPITHASCRRVNNNGNKVINIMLSVPMRWLQPRIYICMLCIYAVIHTHCTVHTHSLSLLRTEELNAKNKPYAFFPLLLCLLLLAMHSRRCRFLFPSIAT